MTRNPPRLSASLSAASRTRRRSFASLSASRDDHRDPSPRSRPPRRPRSSRNRASASASHAPSPPAAIRDDDARRVHRARETATHGARESATMGDGIARVDRRNARREGASSSRRVRERESDGRVWFYNKRWLIDLIRYSRVRASRRFTCRVCEYKIVMRVRARRGARASFGRSVESLRPTD